MRGAAAAFHRPGYDGLAILLLCAVFALVLATFTDYGITWDEDQHFWYGYQVVAYYRSLFHDTTALTSEPLCWYGAAFDAVTALVANVSPFGGYTTRHLLNALVGLVGLVGSWKLARQLGGPRAGFWGVLLLLLTPTYYGQMFNNPKDIPFAAAYGWSLYYLVRLLPHLPRPPWRDTLKLAVAIGLALGVRVGGLLPLCYLGLTLAAMLGLRAWRAGQPRLALSEALIAAREIVLPVLLVSYAIMLVAWPWAQIDPVSRPIAALLQFDHHDFPYQTLYDGAYYFAPHLPRLYLPVHILIQLPELIVFLLMLGAIWAVWRSFRPKPQPETVIALGLVGFAAAFPVLYAVAIRATLFDGMRHFVFVEPPLVCLAALTMDRLAAALRRHQAAFAAASACLVLYLGYHASLMIALHPDEYVYYNAFIGGVPGAAGRFKLDYWANSYREAALDLVRWLEARDGARFAHRRYLVAACGPPGSIMQYLPENLVYEADRSKADFYVSFTKDDCDKSIAGRPVAEVDRLGTRLSVVLDLHPERSDFVKSGP